MNPRFYLLCLFSILLICNCGSSDDEPVPVISAASGIQVFDINNRGNASDIRVFFSSGATLTNLAEFRIMIVPEAAAGGIGIDDFPASGNSVLVHGAENGQVKLNLNAALTDSQGNAISHDTPYKLAIASIHQNEEGVSPVAISPQSFTLTDTPLRDLYVSNSRGNSVIIIDEVTGELIGNFVGSGSGGLNNTQEVIINDDGDFLVTGLGNNALKLYSGITGQFIRDFTTGYTLGGPTKTSIGPDNLIYVSQWQNNVNDIARFNYETGEFVDEFVTNIDRAMGHAWDNQGNYYLASFGTPSVIKYDQQGNRLMTIGSATLQGPVNVWVNNSQRRLYVVDWPVGMVKMYNIETGELIGNYVTGLQRVEGFLFGNNDALYLCDWLANAVNEYDANTGTLRRSIPISVLNNPNGIIYGPNKDPN